MTNDYGNLELQPLVSIIIPVYNVEKYLKDCVDSVRNQTYTNLEIILVDDGSPDRCGQMCDQYAAEDARIIAIHQENGGVASARNAALCVAQGEYVFLVDSDDTITEDAIAHMVALSLQCSADMVCAASYSTDENGRVLQEVNNEGSVGTLVMNQADAMIYYAPKEWGPCNRLIKLHIHKGVKFPAYRICEDEAIKFRLLEQCNIVVNTDKVMYYYRIRGGSATAKDSNTDRMDMFYSRSENLNYLKENHPSVAEHFIPNVCNAALYNLGVLIQQKNSDKRTKRIQEIVTFVLDNYCEIIQNPFLTTAQKIRFLFIKHSDWSKNNCLYVRFYTLLEKIRGR